MKGVSVKIIIALVFLMFPCLSVYATNADNASAKSKQSEQNAEKIFRSIEPKDAFQMLEERDDIIFLDVRTPKERARGAIPGSTLVSLTDLMKGKLTYPKDKPILVVCAVGGRSYVAAQVLSKRGHMEVYNLSGGVKAWYQAGLPIIRD